MKSDRSFDFFLYEECPQILLQITSTLASGIDVGPTFINFEFFSRPYSLIREYIKVI